MLLAASAVVLMISVAIRSRSVILSRRGGNFSSVLSMSTTRFPAFLDDEMKATPSSMLDSVKDKLVKLYPVDVTPSAEIVHRQASDYYLPVYCYLKYLLQKKKKSGGRGPLFVGISAPQGSGKTTLTDLMQALLSEHDQVDATIMSLDDFYLTADDQAALRTKHADNKLLELRGNAGSHDMPLMMNTLKDLGEDGNKASVPRYDKSINNGRGDRAPKDQWVQVDEAPVIVLFEGWMLGFDALPSTEVEEGSSIATVNQYLSGYDSLHSVFEGWLIIGLTSMDLVYKWREHAEKAMRARGKGGMTEEEVKDFVDRYMPAYEHYLPGLYKAGPGGRKKSTDGNSVDALIVTIDENRMPVSVKAL